MTTGYNPANGQFESGLLAVVALLTDYFVRDCRPVCTYSVSPIRYPELPASGRL